MLINDIIQIYLIIPKTHRWRFWILMSLSVFLALVDLIGIASILPLVSLIMNPDQFDHIAYLNKLLSAVGYPSRPPIHIIAIATISLFITANILSITFSINTVLFSSELATNLSTTMAKANFSQGFNFFLKHSPSNLSTMMCNEVSRFCFGGVMQLFFLLSRIIQIIFISGFLITMSPDISIKVIFILTLIYGVIFRTTGKKMKIYGGKYISSFISTQHFATELFASSREIIISDKTDIFIKRIENLLREALHAESMERILPSLPRYILEIAAVALIFSMPIYRSYTGEDPRIDLPIIAAFGFSGLRLLPAMQQLYNALSIIKYYIPIAKKIEEALKMSDDNIPECDKINKLPSLLELVNVSYSHENNNEKSIKDLSLKIPRGIKLAIVGPSGAGKSTLLDLLLGLTSTSSGHFLVNNIDTYKKLKWDEKIIGYVPQSPLIITDTIFANISFGSNMTQDVFDACFSAAKKANIFDEINKLPNQFWTILGENGTRLSGGEMQRLTIARALYHNPQLIILDEPASGLDNITSGNLFRQITEIGDDITVIASTHNLNYLNYFDYIILLDKGEIRASGNFNEVSKSATYKDFSII